MLTLLATLALASCAAYLTLGVRGNWAFVLERRATTLATMAVVGVAIAVATVLFHAVTANRILTPSVMGFDALYVLVQTVAVVVGGTLWTSQVGPLPRFALETLIMLVVAVPVMRWLVLGERRSTDLVVLTGLVAGGVFRALSSFLQRVMDPTEFVVLQDRLFADFSSSEPALLGVTALVVALVAAAVWRLRSTLDVLALGRDLATTLGVDHARATLAVLVAVTLLVSVSTSLVGPTTFFGLLVAHLAYRLVGSHRHALTLPAASLAAITALVGGQVVFERLLGFDGSLSIVVELLGGLLFLALCVRRTRA
ncbi:iron chelate uptake ABC transporter family permease subunit [Actinomycetota bacterium]